MGQVFDLSAEWLRIGPSGGLWLRGPEEKTFLGKETSEWGRKRVAVRMPCSDRRL